MLFQYIANTVCVVFLRKYIHHCLAKFLLILACKKSSQFRVHPVLLLFFTDLVCFIQSSGSFCFLLRGRHVRVHRGVNWSNYIYSSPILSFHSLTSKNQGNLILRSGIQICLCKSFHSRKERQNSYTSQTGH